MKIQMPNRKRLLLGLYIAGGLALLVSGGLWGYKMMTDPERVFWAMIERSLSTHGVSVETETTASGTRAQQVTQYSAGAPNLSHAVTTLTQAGTMVRNEVVGTPDADYTRYLEIETDQKSSKGQKLDFSKIIGVWAKSEGQARNQLFMQTVLGTGLPLGGLAVPVGNLSSTARQQLIDKLHDDNVYQLSFSKVKKEWSDGRLYYTYEASLPAVAYVGMMKAFAQAIGLHNLDQLDPKTFKGQAALNLYLRVDVWSHHLVRVETANRAVIQTYSSYDVPASFAQPDRIISLSELQNRFMQALQ